MKKQLKIYVEKIKQLIWPFWSSDPTGLPVYYEDTGDRMGTVTSVTRDASGEPSGYRVRHDDTGTVVTLSPGHLERTKRGLLFIPLWYVEGLELVRELEYAARHPALQDVVAGAGLVDSELHDVASVHPELREKIAHARQAQASLDQQRRELQRKRRDVRERLMELSEQRLLQDISRRTFAEAVTRARRRARILDYSMERCSDLLARLDAIPFLPDHTSPPETPEPEEPEQPEEDITPLRDIMHNIPISVAVMDREGVIRSVNEQFTDTLHYPPETVTGQPLTTLVVEGTPEFRAACSDGDTPRDVEFTVQDGRGRERHMFGRAMQVTDNGHGPVVALAFQEKIEESDEFRKLLSTQISHEFFNPLCIAQGYLYLLEEGKYGSLTQEQQRQIRSVGKNLKRIEHLVKQTVQVEP